MKKTDIKKLKRLRLSRETLRELASSDARKIAGGNQENVPSCPSACEDGGELTPFTGCGGIQ
jgi:hypothetical protein